MEVRMGKVSGRARVGSHRGSCRGQPDKEAGGLVPAEVGEGEGTRWRGVLGDSRAWCMVRGGQVGPGFMAQVTRALEPCSQRGGPGEGQVPREFIWGCGTEAADSWVRRGVLAGGRRLGITG